MSDPARDRETLLIVDDEEGPRESLKIVFEARYNVVLARSGEEALAIAKTTPVNAAVLDIRMSGMSGVDVLRGLKAIDRNIEVIMLTAYETLETARQALRLGARDYIGKPFNVKAMRTAVENAMEHRRIALSFNESVRKLDTLQTDLENVMMREEMARTSTQVYAGVLHDINNPLTIIRGYVDILMHRLTEASGMGDKEINEFRENMNTVAQQVNVCCSISNRHLEMLRREKPEGQLISVNLILQDLEELIKVHPSVKKAVIKVNRLDNDATVFIHSSELMQILLNLVTNSLQSSPDQQHVSVSAFKLDDLPEAAHFQDGPEERIINAETLDPDRPYIGIAISDTGKGIPSEIINDIFEPYFTTKRDSQGTGLGLAIVSRLIRRNRGAVHLRTRVNEGTTFTLYLPMETNSSGTG
jgi:two-component system, sensor histidine kinase and response regulator